MATRSKIGIENEDGTVSAVYCHWNGHPDDNGRMLKECYSEREKVKQLLKLGDIYTLGEDIGSTEAYYRDLCKRYYPETVYLNVESFRKELEYEYGYVLSKEGEWLVFENH